MMERPDWLPGWVRIEEDKEGGETWTVAPPAQQIWISARMLPRLTDEGKRKAFGIACAAVIECLQNWEYEE